jgi:hypothetical protein
VYIIPENYWLFFASSNALCVWVISKPRIGASRTKEGFKDIEEYAYSESAIRPYLSKLRSSSENRRAILSQHKDKAHIG